MSEYKQYRRKGVAEMIPWTERLDISFSISDPDKAAGSPKDGDMIARNPNNHDDKWLVSAQYFRDNFEPLNE